MPTDRLAPPPAATVTVAEVLFAIVGGSTDDDLERATLEPNGEVLRIRAAELPHREHELVRASVILLWHDVQMDERLLARLPSCHTIVRIGTGVDNVDIEAAGSLGIAVVNVPDYGTSDVADHTMALLLSAARGLDRYASALRADIERGWRIDVGGSLRRLTNRTLGIVGFGRIGSAVAHRARAFGLHVCFFDPFVADGVEKAWQVDRCTSLEQLVARSDILSLHTPLTPLTHRMISAELLGVAHDGLILVNTARGALVDLAAVHTCLRSGRLAAFAADVLFEEPPSPDDPLIRAFMAGDDWLMGRLILTPHAAIYSAECLQELRTKAAQAALRAVRLDALANCVNVAHLRHRSRWPHAAFPMEH